LTHAPRYPFRYPFSGDRWANVPANQLLGEGGTLIPSPAPVSAALEVNGEHTALVRERAQLVFDRYGVAAMAAIHAPATRAD
jgi:hypothetical protein